MLSAPTVSPQIQNTSAVASTAPAQTPVSHEQVPQPYTTAPARPPHRFTADSFLSRDMTADELKVWFTASNLAQDTLTTYGNVLSKAHSRAVMSLMQVFTAVCLGNVLGRLAVAMPTGAGKTVSAACFITALHRHGRPEAVAVCCERVAQLLTFRTELLGLGVPESEIGVWYSDDYRMPDGSRPTVPSTTEPETKQYLLLTHSRTRSKTDLERLNSYKVSAYESTTRSLFIHDESLMASSHSAFEFDPLTPAAAWLRSVAETWRPKTRDPKGGRARQLRLLALADYLQTQCLPLLSKDRKHQMEEQQAPKLLRLPPVEPQILTDWSADLRVVYGRIKAGRGNVTLIRKLLKMHGQPIRVVAFEESALVTYAIAVPAGLNRLVILDASFPVRLLENMDNNCKTGIKQVTGFEEIKDWSDVSLTIERGASGRDPISKNFGEHAAWAIEKIKGFGTDAVLVLTFNDRPNTEAMEVEEIRQFQRDETNMVSRFRQMLKDAKVERPERVQFLTFGNETSLSDYKHIPHVIFLGVLHRSDVDLAGAFLGQARDLKRPVKPANIFEAKLGEQAHGIYQGLSRGTCRTIVSGKALPMTVHIRYNNPQALWAALAPVMPGCTPTLASPPAPANVARDAESVLAALLTVQTSGTTTTTVSLRDLKKSAGIAHPVAFHRAVTRALELQGSTSLAFDMQQVAGWSRVSRSLIKSF